jgi:hypothetical protein
VVVAGAARASVVAVVAFAAAVAAAAVAAAVIAVAAVAVVAAAAAVAAVLRFAGRPDCRGHRGRLAAPMSRALRGVMLLCRVGGLTALRGHSDWRGHEGIDPLRGRQAGRGRPDRSVDLARRQKAVVPRHPGPRRPLCAPSHTAGLDQQADGLARQPHRKVCDWRSGWRLRPDRAQDHRGHLMGRLRGRSRLGGHRCTGRWRGDRCSIGQMLSRLLGLDNGRGLQTADVRHLQEPHA